MGCFGQETVKKLANSAEILKHKNPAVGGSGAFCEKRRKGGNSVKQSLSVNIVGIPRERLGKMIYKRCEHRVKDLTIL